MESGAFRCDGWESGPVLVAQTFAERLKGLRYRSDGQSMLIRGMSVHGFAMREPLLAVGLDRGQRVVGFRVLYPRRVIWIRRAAQILELPIDEEPPPDGAVLTWERGGPADLVRNSYRQSG
ncbi:MAG TPA: hypothetical protein VM848_19545 [Acidimicrobiia bacterium]|nr:hypothetical protein [Acidimicrobiia bacterium]